MPSWLLNPIAFLALFIAIVICGSYLQAAWGGWRSLAARYAGRTERFRGTLLHLQRGTMRLMTRYGGTLTIGADRSGLYLGVLFVIRVGHPPLFIPWDQIEVFESEGVFLPAIVFVFKDTNDVRLTVSQKLGMRLIQDGGRTIAGKIQPGF